MDDIASPIVGHCRTLSFKKYYALICRSNNKRHDNFVFNDNTDNDWQFYKSCAQWMISLSLLSIIVNIVVIKNNGVNNFVLNDNSDNDWQSF